jgi:SAM-dependent methyltransferase
MIGALGFVAGSAACWELGWWAERRARRLRVYNHAMGAARRLGRPLVVIGAPDSGATSGYGCGDVTVDVAPSSCPQWVRADATTRLPFADNSVVVAAMCVLEYVSDAQTALREIVRVSGGHAYFVGVEPWTLAAYLYPGARRTMPAAYR